jgi:hypothetical protein
VLTRAVVNRHGVWIEFVGWLSDELYRSARPEVACSTGRAMIVLATELRHVYAGSSQAPIRGTDKKTCCVLAQSQDQFTPGVTIWDQVERWNTTRAHEAILITVARHVPCVIGTLSGYFIRQTLDCEDIVVRWPERLRRTS